MLLSSHFLFKPLPDIQQDLSLCVLQSCQNSNVEEKVQSYRQAAADHTKQQTRLTPTRQDCCAVIKFRHTMDGYIDTWIARILKHFFEYTCNPQHSSVHPLKIKTCVCNRPQEKQLELLLRWHCLACIAHRHMLLISCQVKLLLLHEVYTGIIWAWTDCDQSVCWCHNLGLMPGTHNKNRGWR